MRLTISKVCKRFQHREIFRNISFELAAGDVLTVTGPNGSGKSTLVKIISGLMRPSEGSVEYFREGHKINSEDHFQYVGFVAPYLQLYSRLTGWENVQFFAKMLGVEKTKNDLLELFARFGLKGREHDVLHTYSSGMLQRMRYVLALMHQPPILILDEPTSNLDVHGVKIVYELIRERVAEQIVIIATNEPEEAKFGTREIKLHS